MTQLLLVHITVHRRIFNIRMHYYDIWCSWICKKYQFFSQILSTL